MEFKSFEPVAVEWRVVITSSGEVAVVASEDVSILPAEIKLVFQANIGPIEARCVSDTLSRAGYMSATCRLKSGESDRVG